MTISEAKPPLWTPSPERLRASNLAAFTAWLAERGHGREHGLDNLAAAISAHGRMSGEGYEALWRWSVSEQEAFWSAAWDWFGIVGEKGGRAFVPGREMHDARYFPGARLNVAENMLRRSDDAPAIIAGSEDGGHRAVSWRELHSVVSRLAQAMRARGIGPGDRVAALLPNIPEAVAIMLAAASIGAVLATASPDFGVRGVIDRFAQLSPRLLFVVDGYRYRGRRYDTLARLPAIAAGLPALEGTVIVPNPAALRAKAAATGAEGSATGAKGGPSRGGAGRTGPAWEPGRAVEWDTFLRPFAEGPIDFARLPFDHPLYTLFSSGTTGPPKAIVHRAGGVLLQHIKEHRLHCDIRPGDRVFFFTTLGWMMWNWLISALASRATILLWDGSPVHPAQDALFDFADAAKMTLMGVSPGYLAALRTAGIRPRESHDLGSLRTLLSTGSPLVSSGYDFVYRHIKRDLHLASISGGTDLCACFVGAVPGLPVRAGAIQGPALGMAVDVVAPDGPDPTAAIGGGPVAGAAGELSGRRPLQREMGDPKREMDDLKPGRAELMERTEDGTRGMGDLEGKKGELVCTAPFPSLPLGFLGDRQGTRYRAAYFERFPGVWHHGDYAEKTAHGGYIIHGRSDATLNVRGVRIGTAEIYRPLAEMAEVAEAVAVAQRWNEGTRMILFVRPSPGCDLDAALRKRIREVLRTQASPRHVPARIVQVKDVPRTRSGKVVELAVAAVVHGEPVRNVEALANPEALEEFRGRVEVGRAG